MLIIPLLLPAFLPFIANLFVCDAIKPPKLHIRAKRDFLLPSVGGGNSAPPPCGCVSKYAPINCRCTSSAGDSGELLCHCHRALVSSPNREDPSSSGNGNGGARGESGGGTITMAQCAAAAAANCRAPPAAEEQQQQNLFFRQAQQQQQNNNYGFGRGGSAAAMGQRHTHSACHPICHKSCTHSCTSSRPVVPTGAMVDAVGINNNNFVGGAFPAADMSSRHAAAAAQHQHLQHNQQQQQQPRMTMDSSAKVASTSSNGICFPSQCRANCLRACAQIFDGQQRQEQQQIRENYVSTNGIESGDNTNEFVEEPHYQVEMGGGQQRNKQGPSDYGSNNNNNGMMMGMSKNGCQCSPSAAANMCECQGSSCYPICVDTCESNCLQQQLQQTPANQRAQCAQFCHLECQHDCAVEGQQQQQRMPMSTTRKGDAEGIDKINNNNDNIMNWPSASSRKNGNAAGNPIAICAHKCPRACEQACQSAQNGEPNNNCVPTCIGLCAQSCARGMQFDAVGLTQQMAMPMPAMAPVVDFGTAAARTAAQTQNISNGIIINAGTEYGQKQQQQMNDWGGEMVSSPVFGQNDGPSAGFGGGDAVPFETMAEMGTVPMIENPAGDVAGASSSAGEQPTTMGGQQQQARTTAGGGGGPCAPLCQPECRPECNRRYMEEGHDDKDQRQESPLQYGPMIVMSNNHNGKSNGKNGRENAGDAKSGGTDEENGGHPPFENDQSSKNDQQQQTTAKQQPASSSSAMFPPHIILDEGMLTGATPAIGSGGGDSSTLYNDDTSSPNVTATNVHRQTAVGLADSSSSNRLMQQLDKMALLRTQNGTGTRRGIRNGDGGVGGSAELYLHQQKDHANKTNNNNNNTSTRINEVREKQQRHPSTQQRHQQQRRHKAAAEVPSAVKREDKQQQEQGQHRHHHHRAHHHNHTHTHRHQQQQQQFVAVKNGTTATVATAAVESANVFFRRRKPWLGNDRSSKVPKKVPSTTAATQKNGKGAEKMPRPLKAVKKGKSDGEKVKEQNDNAKQLQ